MIATPSSSAYGPDRLRVGIDLVQISRIRESIAAFGERFARRLFTPDEIAYASAEEPLAAERFAARFAAKEAALKAFGLSHAGIDWREIEVLRHADGHCSLRLHGKAASLAGAPLDHETALSLSHEGDYAVAIVTALKAAPIPTNNH
jgi:holo-[acyl-carrier protein] synthase